MATDPKLVIRADQGPALQPAKITSDPFSPRQAGNRLGIQRQARVVKTALLEMGWGKKVVAVAEAPGGLMERTGG
jgi:hypothetical protein